MLQLIEDALMERLGAKRVMLVVDTHPSGKDTVTVTNPVLLKVAAVLVLLTATGKGDHTTEVGVPEAPELVNVAKPSVLLQLTEGINKGGELVVTQTGLEVVVAPIQDVTRAW